MTIIEGQVAVQVRDADGYQTNIYFDSVTELRNASKAEREAAALAQIEAERAALAVSIETEVAECDELIEQIEAAIAADDLADVDYARAWVNESGTNVWSVLRERGTPTVTAALRRALSPVLADDWRREVELALAFDATLADVPQDGTLASRITAWQAWADANQIDLG